MRVRGDVCDEEREDCCGTVVGAISVGLRCSCRARGVHEQSPINHI
jgi:hypothetical protein